MIGKGDHDLLQRLKTNGKVDLSFNELFLDIDTYTEVKQRLYDFIFQGDGFSLNKNRPIHLHLDDGESVEIKSSNLLLTLAALRVYALTGTIPNSSLIYGMGVMNSGTLQDYLNTILSTVRNDLSLDNATLGTYISDTLLELSEIGNKSNLSKGNTIDLYSLCKLYRENEEFADIVNFTIPDGLEFNEIEDAIEKGKNRLNNILKTSDTALRPLLLSGGAINIGQAVQTFLAVGLKPDLEGRIIPHAINTSFLRGLRSEMDYYVDAIGGRKALITNFGRVKDSGYLNRKLSLLAIDTFLTGEEQCDTKYSMPVMINSEEIFKKLIGRRLRNGSIIQPHHQQQLLATTKPIPIRSPITCTSKHPNGNDGICNYCYGEMHKVNGEYHVGILAVLYITSKITQLLLSSKHLLATRSPITDWPEEFVRHFSINQAEVNAKTDLDKVSIRYEDVMQDEDGSYVTQLRINDGEMIEVPSKLYLSNRLYNLYNTTNNRVLSIDNVIKYTQAFTIQVDNIELSSTLDSITKLIEQKNHLGWNNDIRSILNVFLKLLVDSNIRIQSNHIEIILKMLTRDPEELTKLPDFSAEWRDEETGKVVFPDVEVLTVQQAILNSPGISASLSFERIKQQFLDPSTFNKTGPGLLDRLYI